MSHITHLHPSSDAQRMLYGRSWHVKRSAYIVARILPDQHQPADKGWDEGLKVNLIVACRVPIEAPNAPPTAAPLITLLTHLLSMPRPMLSWKGQRGHADMALFKQWLYLSLEQRLAPFKLV